MPRRSAVPDVGSRLAAARRRRGLSQGTVARLSGIAPSYLSRIETGKVQPTFRTVVRVARALKLSPEEVLGPGAVIEQEGACPVSVSGRCMLDLIRSPAQVRMVTSGELYTPREIRLLQRLADWMRRAGPDRLRAMEVLLDEMLRGRPRAARSETTGRGRRSRTRAS